jgi:hypothetical protein
VTHCSQAILSQFTQKKASTIDSEDDADEAMLESLDDDANEDKEEIEAEGEDKGDDDELDPAVEASDNMIINEVAAEVDDGEVPSLMKAETNLGRFAITKVRSFIIPC